MASCTRKQCRSGKPGLWEPIVLIWPRKKTLSFVQPISVNCLDHRVCFDCTCRGVSQIQDFVPTSQDWQKIARNVVARGYAEPTLRNAQLTFMIPETRISGREKIG